MSGSGSFEVVIAKVELPFGLVPRANRQQWQQATPKCEDDAEALHQDMDTGTEAEPAALAKGLKWVKRRKKPTGGQPTLAVETSYEGFASTLLARSGSAADQDHDVESGLSQDDQDACPVDAIDSGADDLPESARAEHAKVSAMSRLARSDVDPTSNPPPVETTETTLPPPRRVFWFSQGAWHPSGGADSSRIPGPFGPLLFLWSPGACRVHTNAISIQSGENSSLDFMWSVSQGSRPRHTQHRWTSSDPSNALRMLSCNVLSMVPFLRCKAYKGREVSKSSSE